VFTTAVKRRIRYIDIPGAGILEHSGRGGYFPWWRKAEPRSLYMGISAIDALEGTAPFCLQIEHAASFQVERSMGMIRGKTAAE
jgi:hypothetical protein